MLYPQVTELVRAGNVQAPPAMPVQRAVGHRDPSGARIARPVLAVPSTRPRTRVLH